MGTLFLIILIVVLLALVLGGGGYTYRRYYSPGTGTEVVEGGGGGGAAAAVLVLLVLAVLYVSGIAELKRYTSILDPVGFLAGAHGLAAGAAAVLVAGHMYLALVHPETRPALRGITLGAVRRDWAEHHHARWVESIDAQAAKDASVTAARPAERSR